MSETTKQFETEKITIEVPKPIMNFLRAHIEKPEEYILIRLMSVFNADLETDGGYFFDHDDLISLYDLGPVFEAFDITYKIPSS